jgi:hypothetical protein
MYSYPNMIPLREKEILYIQQQVAPLQYDAIYGAFGRYILKDAQQSMGYSIERYLRIYR